MVFGTVAAALKRDGITLEGDDYTEPALDQLVSAGSTITVHRVDYTDRVETQAIPYDTEYVYHQPACISATPAAPPRCAMVRKASRPSPPATAMWTANWKQHRGGFHHHRGAHQPCHQDLWRRRAGLPR